MSNDKEKSLSGLSADEMCQALGISVRTLRRRVKKGQIKKAKINGDFFYFTGVPKPMALAPVAQVGRNGTGTVSQECQTEESPTKSNIRTLNPRQNSVTGTLALAPQPEIDIVPLTEQIRELTRQVIELSTENATLKADQQWRNQIWESELGKIDDELERLYAFEKWAEEQFAQKGAAADRVKQLSWWKFRKRKALLEQL